MGLLVCLPDLSIESPAIQSLTLRTKLSSECFASMTRANSIRFVEDQLLWIAQCHIHTGFLVYSTLHVLVRTADIRASTWSKIAQ